MDRSEPPAWEPQKLRAADLRTPMTAALRRLPKEHRDDLHRQRVRRDDHFTPGSDTWRAHFVKRAIYAGILFVVVSWLFTPVPLFAYPLVPAAFVYGAGIAWFRPGRWLCGLWSVLVGALLMAITGTGVVSYLGVLSVFLYFVFGMITEISDRLSASDGE